MESTRERLLDTAGQMFGQRGYEGASVRDICQAAEANLAAVNYHFGDKQRLYIESVKQACGAGAKERPLPNWAPDTPPRTRLRQFIETMVARMVDYPGPAWHLQLMMREMAAPTEACGELVRDFIRPHFVVLEGILRELLPQAAPADVRLAAFSVIGQCLYHRLARPVIRTLIGEKEFKTHTAERLARHIADFTLAAVDPKRTEH